MKIIKLCILIQAVFIATVSFAQRPKVKPGITHVTCIGSTNGSIILTAIGTSTPYTYTWQPGGATGSSITSKGVGNYSVTIKTVASTTASSTYNIGYKANWINLYPGLVVSGDNLVQNRSDMAGTWLEAAYTSNTLLPSTDGWIEYVVTNTGYNKALGLLDVPGGLSSGFNDIDYGIMLNSGGSISILTSGSAALSAATYTVGDVIHIGRVGTGIVYSINGTTIATDVVPGAMMLVNWMGKGVIYDYGAMLESVGFSFPSLYGSAGPPQTITCAVGTVTLTGSSTTPSVTYSWTPGGSTSSTIAVATAGTYTVKITNPTTGCSITATTAVVTNTTPPNATINNPAAASVPTLGLNAYWPFNGNAQDQSGNANHGIASGAALAADRFGNANMAYSFNGTTSRIDVPHSSTIDMTTGQDYTMSFWIKSNTGNSNAIPIAKGTYGSINGYAIYVNNTGAGYCNSAGQLSYYVAAGSNGDACANNPISNDATQWYHITGQYKYSTNLTTIFVNSVLQTDMGSSSGTLSNTKKLSFGAYNDGSLAYFNGYLDDIRFYNRLLTQTEINALYNEPNPAGVFTCTTPSVVLTGTSTTSGITYSWSPGGITTYSNNVSVAGTYTLKVTNSVNGCSTSAITAILANTVAPTLTLTASSPSLCAGSAGTLTASGAPTYSWNFGPTTASVTGTPSVTTSYSVVGTGTNGCVSTKTISITVYSLSANAGVDVFVSTGSLVTLGGSPSASAGSGSYSYSWTPSTAYSPSSTNANPSITANTTYNFMLTVKDLTTGCVKTAFKIVSIDGPYYFILKKTLDAGYYNSFNQKLYFQFEEEYFDASGALSYSIVTDQNSAVSSPPTLIEVIGDNRFSINLSAISGLSAGSFYRIAVTNKKNEVFYARFKY